MPQESYYATLGLRPDATPSQIEAACKQMLRLYQSSGAKSERLSQLQEIQAVLSDPSRRAAYNLTLKPEPADTGRARTAAEPGLALRWLALLGIVALPLIGALWWVSRPAPAARPQTAADVKPAPLDGRAAELVHQKNMERDRLLERKNKINEQLAFMVAGQRKVENGEVYDYEESDKREAAAFRLELAWIDDRLATIDRIEMEQARRGVTTPHQIYQAPAQ